MFLLGVTHFWHRTISVQTLFGDVPWTWVAKSGHIGVMGFLFFVTFGILIYNSTFHLLYFPNYAFRKFQKLLKIIIFIFYHKFNPKNGWFGMKICHFFLKTSYIWKLIQNSPPLVKCIIKMLFFTGKTLSWLNNDIWIAYVTFELPR